MQIAVKYSVLKEIIKINSAIKEMISFWKLSDIEKEENKDQVFIIDLVSLSKSNLEQLQKQLVQLDVHKRTITIVQNWLENISDPLNAEIGNLKHLEKTLTAAIKANNFKWIMVLNDDGYWLPAAVTQIHYKNRSRDDSEYVYLRVMSTCIGKSYRWDSDDVKKLENQEEGYYFYRSDLSENGEDEVVSVYDFEESEIEDEEDEDDETKKKVKKPRTKKAHIRFSTILANKGLMLITKQHIDEYNENLNLWHNFNKQTGNVYTGVGKGYIIEDKFDRAYGRWGFLNEEDKTSKLVIDPLSYKEIVTSKSTDTFGNVQIPIEPYIFTYNLSLYCWANVHVASLKKYVFDKDCIDKLIISESKKKLLSALIGSKNKFVDIISGKSGGIIILCSGKPGLGKTLTAEIYSELMELPLYSIQSSQLGITVETIERNLNSVLLRADRWNAVLLIDEADCYVYKRGNDILQNCIVGTFLRVLEYYNGILFLTTNRGEIVDDAIMSRVTAHVKYDYPTKPETFKLWSVLSVNFDRKIDMKTANAIWNKYEPICGRDIRNVLKMLSKYNPKEKEITLGMLEELKEFIPFLKHRGEVITEDDTI